MGMITTSLLCVLIRILQHLKNVRILLKKRSVVKVLIKVCRLEEQDLIIAKLFLRDLRVYKDQKNEKVLRKERHLQIQKDQINATTLLLELIARKDQINKRSSHLGSQDLKVAV